MRVCTGRSVTRHQSVPCAEPRAEPPGSLRDALAGWGSSRSPPEARHLGHEEQIPNPGPSERTLPPRAPLTPDGLHPVRAHASASEAWHLPYECHLPSDGPARACREGKSASQEGRAAGPWATRLPGGQGQRHTSPWHAPRRLWQGPGACDGSDDQGLLDVSCVPVTEVAPASEGPVPGAQELACQTSGPPRVEAFVRRPPGWAEPVCSRRTTKPWDCGDRHRGHVEVTRKSRGVLALGGGGGVLLGPLGALVKPQAPTPGSVPASGWLPAGSVQYCNRVEGKEQIKLEEEMPRLVEETHEPGSKAASGDAVMVLNAHTWQAGPDGVLQTGSRSLPRLRCPRPGVRRPQHRLVPASSSATFEDLRSNGSEVEATFRVRTLPWPLLSWVASPGHHSPCLSFPICQVEGA